jgi:hypothetical protein
MLIKQPADRIWELFKQSGIDISEDQEGNIEKFAELLIKECAAIANRAENDEYWIAPVGDLIYQHFGVKE